ncbi:MAG: hydrogenase iron-sulfur subunit [Methermicoccaceae archaeon]
MSERGEYLTEQQVRAELGGLRRGGAPLVVAFVCSWCCVGAEPHIPQDLNASIEVMRVKCTGAVSSEMVFEALEKGADGVLIAGCKLGECKYKTGNYECLARMDALKREMRKRGLSVRRVEAACLPPSDGNGLIDALRALVRALPRA